MTGPEKEALAVLEPFLAATGSTIQTKQEAA